MPFSSSFVRTVSGSGTALGSDTIPSTLTGAAAIAYTKSDNVFAITATDTQPTPKGIDLVVTYQGSGSPSAVTASIFLWDPDIAGVWDPVQEAQTIALPLGNVVSLPVPLPLSAASHQVVLAVLLAGSGEPAGTYTCAVGAAYAEAQDAAADANLADIATSTAATATSAATVAGTVSGKVQTQDATADTVLGGIAAGSTFVPIEGKTTGGSSAPLLEDASGRPIVVGAGTAGGPAGGVVTVQGVSGGQAVPTADAVLDAAVTGGALGVTVQGSASAPAIGATVVLSASHTLAAGSAFDAAPSGGSAGVAIPLGTELDQTRGATIDVEYTQGTSGGQAMADVWAYDGTNWFRVPNPVDESFDSTGSSGVACYSLGQGTGNYGVSIKIGFGWARLFATFAEKGVPGTPGTVAATVVFG